MIINKEQEEKIKNLIAKDIFGVSFYPANDPGGWKGADIEQRETLKRVIAKIKKI